MDVSYTTHTSEIRLSLGKRFGRGEEGGGTLVYIKLHLVCPLDLTFLSFFFRLPILSAPD